MCSLLANNFDQLPTDFCTYTRFTMAGVIRIFKRVPTWKALHKKEIPGVRIRGTEANKDSRKWSCKTFWLAFILFLDSAFEIPAKSGLADFER